MQPLHDLIGSTYAASRRADPAIVQELCRKISLEPSGAYLDLGCGTGNYTVALSSLGGAWSAIDASEIMLAQAAQKSPCIDWIQSSAERLPFADGSFDGAICTLAIHHFPELESPFAEVRRTLRSGRFVIFTGLAEQMHHYWLCHYFPEMMARAIRKMPSEAAIREALVRSGFTSVDTTPFHVTNELQDLFLFSGKHRPAQYLDSAVRANISSFASLAPAAELHHGLLQLEADLQSGAFALVKERYAFKAGDYAYITALIDA